MTDLREQLQATLGSAYTLERELGGGGMSRVFVAEETALARKVVIKVLLPELAAGVSVDRFRREIQLAAKLQHACIVPLLSAGIVAEGRGDASPLPYYTMPLVEGESLRHRLARSGELPVSEAVKILRDVAEALSYAHEHGVVHRDIKPDNVLVTKHHALVTDFGVAKAVSSATNPGTSLTSLGVALGTPAYMAPEQAAADPATDHRADLYALGAMAYEMLTGQQVFGGRPPQQMLAAHATETAVPVTTRRSTVPPPLAALVMKCLEKHPADRPQAAEEVLLVLEALATPSGGMTPTTAAMPAVAPRARRRMWPLVAGASAVVVAGFAVYTMWPRVQASLDPHLVVVAPFRVSGADPSLAYLREGMVDLLAAKLTGEGGPRATDPRSTLSAWRREAGAKQDDLAEGAALKVARGLGAGQLLLGAVVGSRTHLVLTATLLSVPSGRTQAQSNVEGAPDSLPVLLERLTAQLLARGAGEGEQRLASLTTTSLEALRGYLDGQAEYRQGHYDQAAIRLKRALQIDSSFALAAFALDQTCGWGACPDGDRVEAVAWRLRDRLSPRDQVLLEAFVGPHGPGASSGAELLAAQTHAVEVVPDQADAWYFLGDQYFHYGFLLGIPDAHQRATAAFRRALVLDSTFAGPLGHLVILAAGRGDTAEVRRLGSLYLRVDSVGAVALYTRWWMALALKDPAGLADMRARIDSSSGGAAVIIAANPWDEGLDLVDADRALAALGRGATTPDERDFYFAIRAWLEFNRGHPRQGLAAGDSANRQGGSITDRFHIIASLYWDADSGTGAEAARRLAPSVEGEPAQDITKRAGQYSDICWVEQWRLTRGDTRTAERSIARLRGAAALRDSAATVARNHVCAAMLEAMLAATQRHPDAAARVERLDSLLRTYPPGVNFISNENLVAARLLAAQGNIPRALAAVRRRVYGLLDGLLLSTYLREEGRLAALAGDHDGAVRAYLRYLAMRSDPEPELRPEVERVKAELAKLVGEPGGR